MSGNTLGRLFRLTTFGESHGPAIGGIVDGCPAGLALDEAAIQHELDRRKPGQSKYTTQRHEEDRVQILSGVFEGYTTGTPIGLLIANQDQRSRDYGEIKDLFRPGHADYTYWRKYGIRDYRGGGRSSARETAVRVAGGAIARQVLARQGVTIRGGVIAIGAVTTDPNRWEWAEVERNPFFTPDPAAVPQFAELIDSVRAQGDSVGALLEVRIAGVPPGWGEPVFDRLDAELAKAMMGINAVKGVEIGAGMAVAAMRGSQCADEIYPGPQPGEVTFGSNHAGGILGGISSGQEIVVRIAIKPTSSLRIPRNTVDLEGRARVISTSGRHDPCVGIRAVPVAEAMAALVLVDFMLIHQARRPGV